MPAGKKSPSELVKIIEDSEAPLAEEEARYSAIKEKVSSGKPLSAIDYNVLGVIARKAEQWNQEVESSAETEPEQTLPGC